MNNPILACENLGKNYRDGKLKVNVLNDLDFTVTKGEQIAIIGPSGSGKSTLLHLLGGLDKPSEGKVSLLGSDLACLSERKRCRLRNSALGFVYQFHHLLPEFAALENVAMPLLIAGMAVSEARKKARTMLELVGLEQRCHHKPAQLSGGERQRVAIARALVVEPACVLADEPTGNLDQNTASTVYQLMRQINQELGTALVIVTHDQSLANKMDRVMQLSEGTLIQL